MTKHYQLVFTVFFAAFVAACSNTRPDIQDKSPGLNARDLMLKDYDEMLAMVQKHTKAAHKIVDNSDSNPNWQSDAKSELLQAERIIMSRPDTDNMVAKLTPEVRRVMSMFGKYSDLLASLTQEGIKAFDPKMDLPTSVKATHLVILQNIMSQMEPDIQHNSSYRALFEQIRDADIVVPDDVVAERKLDSMFLTESPSAQAKRILEKAGFKKKRH